MENKEELEKKTGVKRFSVCVMNPPYDKSLHLTFLENVIDKAYKVVSIQPSTFLINLRKTGKGKRYKELKDKIDKNVKSVEIENYNKTFNTGLFVPYTIIDIDKTKHYNEIEFISCGYKTMVKSINDCNLIGDSKIIESILNKINSDTVSNHLYIPNKTKRIDGNWFLKISGDIITGNLMMCDENFAKQIKSTSSDPYSIKMPFGTYERRYIVPLCFANKYGLSEPQKTPPVVNDRGNKPTDKEAVSITGTHDEIKNWKHFVTTNKLQIFVSICMTIDQHANSVEYVPWIVDKQYTDEEIYRKFDITKEEQQFIDNILYKFERHSPWKIRLMCGENSISDKEVNDYFRK